MSNVNVTDELERTERELNALHERIENVKKLEPKSDDGVNAKAGALRELDRLVAEAAARKAAIITKMEVDEVWKAADLTPLSSSR